VAAATNISTNSLAFRFPRQSCRDLRRMSSRENKWTAGEYFPVAPCLRHSARTFHGLETSRSDDHKSNASPTSGAESKVPSKIPGLDHTVASPSIVDLHFDCKDCLDPGTKRIKIAQHRMIVDKEEPRRPTGASAPHVRQTFALRCAPVHRLGYLSPSCKLILSRDHDRLHSQLKTDTAKAPLATRDILGEFGKREVLAADL